MGVIFSKLKNSVLLKSASIYALSSFINSGISVLLLPMLTRYLTQEQYGVLSMINATISVITPFVGMSISAAIQRNLVDNDDQGKKVYVFNCLIIMVASTVIVALIFIAASSNICRITGISGDFLWVVILIAMFDTLISTALVMLQFEDKVAAYAVYRNFETLLNVLLSVYFVAVLGMSLAGRVYAIFISKALFSVIALILIFRITGISERLDISMIKDELFMFGIPMIPTLLKSTILTYLDRIFITNMESISETGLYTVGNQLSLPILLIAQAFNLAYIPWLYRKMAEDNDDDKVKIVKLTYIYYVVISVGAAAWTVLISFVTGFLVGGDYANSIEYTGWLSLSYAFTGMHMMVVNYIYYMKKIKLYNLVTITVIASNVFLNYILIKVNGSIGAAQATLLVNVISFLLTWIMAARVCKMPWMLWRKK